MYEVVSKSPRGLVINLEGGNTLRLAGRGARASVLDEERSSPELRSLEGQRLVRVVDVTPMPEPKPEPKPVPKPAPKESKTPRGNSNSKKSAAKKRS